MSLHLPIRVRLSLAFAVLMAVLLSASFGFLYLRLGAELDVGIEAELEARAAGVRALMIDEGNDIGRSGESPLEYLEDASVIQVLDDAGRVLEAGADAPAATPLLDPARILRLAKGERLQQDIQLTGVEPQHLRVVAFSERTEEKGRAQLYAIVGASLEERDAALSGLLRLLAIVAPIALLISSAAGFLLATAALRPIEAMRRRAASFTPGTRLPVPASDDEVSRLGRTLNALLERLETTLRRERRLVADASHELRGPLAVLNTELDLAQRGERTHEELLEVIGSAAEESERLTRLAEALLALASADSGTLQVNPRHVEIASLLERVRARNETAASAAGRALRVRDDARGVAIVDELRIEQALGNLIENALRHGDGEITIEASRTEKGLELAVLDHGAGFPGSFINDAFDRFARADPARGRGGAGLGLSIVEAIAIGHGGEAFAENRSAGARVGIRLPG